MPSRLLAAMVLISAAPTWADFQAGQRAYDHRDYATAFQEWHAAAVKGIAEAQRKLGDLYHDGKGIRANDTEALRWYRSAARQADLKARFSVVDLCYKLRGDTFTDGMPSELCPIGQLWAQKMEEYSAIEEGIRELATRGDSEAEFMLSQILQVLASQGKGGAFDEYGWWRPSDKKDSAPDPREREANKWFAESLAQGYIPTRMFILLDCSIFRSLKLDPSLGPTENQCREAQTSLAQVFDDLSPTDQYFVGSSYLEGPDIDPVKALKYLDTAARRDSAIAQHELAKAYAEGTKISRDYRQAAFWYQTYLERAVVLGTPETGGCFITVRWTAYELARLFASGGPALPPNEQAAAKWLRRAAEMGLADAQYMLGLALWFGHGVRQDYVYAHMWLNLASAGGKKEAGGARTSIEKVMVPEQIAQAQELARKWRPWEPTPSAAATSAPDGTSTRPDVELAASGSGFLVSKQGDILTNYHVVDGCRSVTTQIEGQPLPLTILGKDERDDLALLKAVNRQSFSAPFAAGTVNLGQSVLVVGYPLRGLLGSGINVTTGTVSALAGVGDDSRFIQLTAPVQPGNSGGPVLDQSGNVIGIVVGKLDALKIAAATGDIPENVNFAIKGSITRTFLDANRVSYTSAPSTAKLDPTVVSAKASNFTLVIECWK